MKWYPFLWWYQKLRAETVETTLVQGEWINEWMKWADFLHADANSEKLRITLIIFAGFVIWGVRSQGHVSTHAWNIGTCKKKHPTRSRRSYNTKDLTRKSFIFICFINLMVKIVFSEVSLVSFWIIQNTWWNIRYNL